MHSRRRFLLAFAATPVFAALSTATPPAQAARSTFRLEREGDGFAIEAHALVDAPRSVAWLTLVDYESLQRFVPGMSQSRVLERQGDHLVVRQLGAARFGPFSERFDITLSVSEQELRRIDAVAIGGDFIEFRSHYLLEQLDEQRTRLVYRAQLRPRRDPPPLVGVPVMRLVAREQFEALLSEIERRAVRG
jgi:ribosome-associated toxin RatA of RatAB toxin-antitoxin module